MNNKKLKFSKMLLSSAFIYNPVLTQAVGICTVAAAVTTLKLGLTFSVIIDVLLIASELLASLILKKLSRWLRIAAYMLICSLLLFPTMLFLDSRMSGLYASLGIYLPLLAVNSIIVIRCETFAVKNTVKYSFFDAVSASVGFTCVPLIVGAIREPAAYGTLFGKAVSRLPNIYGMALPFGGLLVIGFLAAFQKWLIQKKFPRYPTNTFNLRSAFDRPSLKNDGIYVTDGSFSSMRDKNIIEDEAGASSDEKDEDVFVSDSDNDTDSSEFDLFGNDKEGDKQ